MEIDPIYNNTAITNCLESDALGRGAEPQVFKLDEPWLKLSIESSSRHLRSLMENLELTDPVRGELEDKLYHLYKMELQLSGESPDNGIVVGFEAHLRER